jgi:transposase
MRPSNALPAVYLCRDIVDFCKGINGLAVLVEETLQHDPFSEQLFAFCNSLPRQGEDPVLGA